MSGRMPFCSSLFAGAHYDPIEARPSLAVLAFALLLSVATGHSVWNCASWMTSQSYPADALRRAAVPRSTARRWSESLVIVQVAFSTVLFDGAGLARKVCAISNTRISGL